MTRFPQLLAPGRTGAMTVHNRVVMYGTWDGRRPRPTRATQDAAYGAGAT
ncbi:hypothetical protein [Mycobacterium basiliense]|nr:hypothetical protein [Mycobacterium basiliense]